MATQGGESTGAEKGTNHQEFAAHIWHARRSKRVKERGRSAVCADIEEKATRSSDILAQYGIGNQGTVVMVFKKWRDKIAAAADVGSRREGCLNAFSWRAIGEKSISGTFFISSPFFCKVFGLCGNKH